MLKKSELPPCPRCGKTIMISKEYFWEPVLINGVERVNVTHIGYMARCQKGCVDVCVKLEDGKHEDETKKETKRAWCAVVESMKGEE